MENRTESIHVRFHKDDELEMAAYDYLRRNNDKIPYSKIIAEAIHHYLTDGREKMSSAKISGTDISDEIIRKIANAVIAGIRREGLVTVKERHSAECTDVPEVSGCDDSLISAEMLDFACGR